MAQKIKAIKKYSFEFSQQSFGNWSEIENEPVLASVTQYDEKGRIVEEVKYDADSEIEERHHYQYDNNNKVIEYKMEMPMDQVEETIRTKRNEKGQALFVQKFYGEDASEKKKYAYSDDGEVQSFLSYDEEGVPESREVYQYDEKKRLIKREVFEPDALTRQTHFTYNEKDEPLEQSEHDSKNNLLNKVVFTYDDHGNQIKVLQLNDKGAKTSIVTTTYDDLHRPIERKSSGFYTRITYYGYDNKGNLTEETLSDENGMIITRSLYDYDENNRLAADAYYETDLTRAGRDTSMGSRYEYEFMSE